MIEEDKGRKKIAMQEMRNKIVKYFPLCLLWTTWSCLLRRSLLLWLLSLASNIKTIALIASL